MGYGDAQRQESRQADTQQPARRQAPAAPVSREGGTGGSPRPGTIRLSAAQREAARMAGISDAEYAQSLVALQREGTITH
jgi:phage I-like protein